VSNGRSLPHSREAEEAVLGALILDSDLVYAVSERLVDTAFFSRANGKLFGLLCDLVRDRGACDIVSVVERVLASDNPNAFGSLEYIQGLPERVPTTANVQQHAQTIRHHYMRRQLVALGQTLADDAHGNADLERVIDAAEQQIFELAQGRSTRDWVGLPEVLSDEVKRIQEIAERDGELTGITTGFTDLDGLLAGFQRSDLIILAARPSMGKTALALNFALHAAHAGVGVAVFSLEMGRSQLVNRLICAEGRLDASRVRRGTLTRDEEWPRLREAAATLYKLPIFIDDEAALTLSQVRSKARRIKAQHPEVGLFVLDYLQLMQGTGGPKESREQVISAISRGLKGIAKDLDVPFVALAQLNRGVESRTDKRPMLSDLRESGAIEQDADVILFIYRDDYYKKDQSQKPGVAEILIAKHRNGATGEVELAFKGHFLRFENLEKRFGNTGYV
jgi:replicative DNA helicase